jgi:hypothetical protein
MADESRVLRRGQSVPSMDHEGSVYDLVVDCCCVTLKEVYDLLRDGGIARKAWYSGRRHGVKLVSTSAGYLVDRTVESKLSDGCVCE